MKKSMLLAVSALTMLAVACNPPAPPSAKQDAPAPAAAVQSPSEPITLNGAGATFPYPIYAKWAYIYNKSTGTKLNYQSIGSGGGIAQIKARTVDFGASDAPMKPEELAEAGLIQFPLIMGGVVPVVHLDGIGPGALKLSRAVLADIFLGKIKKWNDKAITSINEGVAIPDVDITVVHRADGSGTTWIFTNYLDKISPEWHEKVGTDKSVEWPAGVGGKGNEGVAAYVQRINGAIGYVEYAYAIQNKMSHAKLETAAGAYVDPTIESFQAAAANADWANAPGMYMVLTDQPGAGSWPITGASFILMYKDQANAAVAKEALNFFSWCYKSGASEASSLHYVPMPEAVITQVENLWKTSLKSGGNAIWN